MLLFFDTLLLLPSKDPRVIRSGNRANNSSYPGHRRGEWLFRQGREVNEQIFQIHTVMYGTNDNGSISIRYHRLSRLETTRLE